MIDYHVHIGQYCNAYYFAFRVFSALQVFGTDELWFSSTTSCIYCKESAVASTDPVVYKTAPSARDLYTGVRSEIRDALRAAKELGIQAHALYWVVPDIHFAQDAGITVARVMEETPYNGFKLHPRAQQWDLQDERTAAIFRYCIGVPYILNTTRRKWNSNSFCAQQSPNVFVSAHSSKLRSLYSCIKTHKPRRGC